MLEWIFKAWRAYQRTLDIRILWPEIKKQAADLDQAKYVFYVHAVNDPAWTKDYQGNDLIDYVDRLN